MASKRSRWLTRRTVIIVVLLTVVALVAVAGVAGASAWQRFNRSRPLQKEISAAVRDVRFDFVRYEIDAIAGKVMDLARRPGQRLSEDEQRRLVWQYRTRAGDIARLQGAVDGIYADPKVADPNAGSAALRARVAELSALQADIRPMVEAIIEGQVRDGLAQTGLTTAGGVFPPVRFNFISPPNILVASPRDRIELDASIHLQPDLDTAGMVAIEDRIAREFNRSTLVEGLGGLGAWPTIVLDYADLAWALETVAHEWVHNYLLLFPLGRGMFDSPDMNTINETVASIVGEEIGQRVAYDSYGIPYPPPPAPRDETPPPPDPDRFDFGMEMRRTRLRVDELLAQGQVDEAERYMEERRQEFVSNGYNLRRLNQAYFAFHGSYATGAASTDPIGPKLQVLRKLMPDLATFFAAVRGIRQPDDLDALLAEWESQQK